MITQAFYDQVVLVFLPPQWGACVCPAGHPWWCVQGHQRGCTRLAGAERPPSACGIPTHLHWHPGASLHPGLLSAHCQVRMTGTETAAWTQIFTLKSGWIWFSERTSGPQLIDTLKYAGPFIQGATTEFLVVFSPSHSQCHTQHSYWELLSATITVFFCCPPK